MRSGPDRSPELTVWTVRPSDRAEPSCLGRLLQDRLHLDEQLDHVGESWSGTTRTPTATPAARRRSTMLALDWWQRR